MRRTPTGKYFVSISTEIEKENWGYSNKSKEEVGIDLGIKDLIVTSDGKKYTNNRTLKNFEKTLKRLQRKFSRRTKGSKNRFKQRLKVASLHEKINNKRLDNLHKLSFMFTSENQAVYIEDLNVCGMLKNHCLSKHIADASWSEFVRQLEYKSETNNCKVVRIGRFEASSKKCSNCSYVYKELKLRERSWICKNCNIKHDRDINAAINIKLIGQGMPKLTPVKRITSVFSIKKKQVGSLKQESRAS